MSFWFDGKINNGLLIVLDVFKVIEYPFKGSKSLHLKLGIIH